MTAQAKVDALVKELSKTITNRKRAAELMGQLASMIQFARFNDWIDHQICGTFPLVDIRNLVFCCSPKKNCPYRNSVLIALGLTVEDYKGLKLRMGKEVLSRFKIFSN